MVIVIKDGERLYLSAWDYNCCRVIGALQTIIENNGGRVKKTHWIMATNRSIGDLEPKKICGQMYISFMLDDMYYYFDIDDNFLFPHHYQKTKVVNGKRRKNVYLEECKNDWIYDCLLEDCGQEEIVEIANQVYNMLLQAKESEIYHEKKTIMVPNTYNEGCHRETVYTPDEWIDVFKDL